MNNKLRRVAIGYGRLKSENKKLKEKIEKLELENKALRSKS